MKVVSETGGRIPGVSLAGPHNSFRAVWCSCFTARAFARSRAGPFADWTGPLGPKALGDRGYITGPNTSHGRYPPSPHWSTRVRICSAAFAESTVN